MQPGGPIKSLAVDKARKADRINYSTGIIRSAIIQVIYAWKAMLKPIVHVVLWSLYVITYAFLWRNRGMSFSESLVKEIAILPFKLILVYTCIGFLIPRFLLKKRYASFIFLLMSMIFVGTMLHNAYLHFVVPENLMVLSPGESLFDWEKITKRMTYLTSPMLFALTLTMILNWLEQKNQNNQIIQQNLKANLTLLKQQLQPHFFFNTLNSIYSLAVQKSDQAPDMILKLSELMHYVTDQNGSDWVNLENEISFIKNYLSLEQIRYQDRVKTLLSSTISSPDKISVPPLVLSPFLENAFKHGVIDNAHSSCIRVDLWEDAQRIYYKVVNSMPPPRKSLQEKGTGLANLRSRLKIIYGEQFAMKAEIVGDMYVAELHLMKK